MATALQGAVIVKQDGSRISYKQKCDKCGNVSSDTTTTTIGSNLTSNFRCSKCGNIQKIQIQK
jgi:transcription elongation factor Elf1